MPSIDPTPPDPAVVFAALGDPTRLSLIADLSRGRARSIARLSADTALTRQAVTKHLRVLELAGLVWRRRTGRETLYSFRPEPVTGAQDYLEAVSARWDTALARFKTMVESGE